jgi:GNAT superfamily N-acetyltransferase
MILIKKTDSSDLDFVNLVQKLDRYLAIVDGDDHAFYDQFNKIVNLSNCVVGYIENNPVACGAIKKLTPNTYELKRMYAETEVRGKGVALQVLTALESWAFELGAEKLVLETGKRQEDAVRFYKKNGYSLIDNYGQYVGIENSLCFEKILIGV